MKLDDAGSRDFEGRRDDVDDAGRGSDDAGQTHVEIDGGRGEGAARVEIEVSEDPMTGEVTGVHVDIVGNEGAQSDAVGDLPAAEGELPGNGTTDPPP